jgi:hypothetical protein
MLYPHARRIIVKVVGRVKLFIVGVGSRNQKTWATGPVTTCGNSSFGAGVSSMLAGVTHGWINVRTVKSRGFCIPGKVMENVAMTQKIESMCHRSRDVMWASPWSQVQGGRIDPWSDTCSVGEILWILPPRVGSSNRKWESHGKHPDDPKK